MSWLRRALARLGMLSILCIAADAAPLAEATDGSGAVSLTGAIEILIVDDFVRGRSEVRYLLHELATGRTYGLRFAGEPPPAVAKGGAVTVEGRLSDGEIVVTRIVPEAKE